MQDLPYCRLFGEDMGPVLDITALEQLGAALVCDNVPARDRGDSRIPAGYTYFGQFIAHDVSFDSSKGIPSGCVEPAQIANDRSEGLVLASIYGQGPESPDRHLFADDGVSLRLGRERRSNRMRGHDLPRDETGRAIIADERNDETVAIAQTQVCLMAFHNRVAEFLKARAKAEPVRFSDVRKMVVQHLQSAVLHDYLWRLVPDEIYFDVVNNGRKLFHPHGLKRGDRVELPVEFTHAAFRFGHSMVRAQYRWNKTIAFSTLEQFLQNTARNGGNEFQQLHPDWVVDWRNFLDFSGIAGIEARKDINFARKIDTALTDLLAGLPEGERAHGEPPNLATRDLLRGRSVKLPTGQEAARQCHRDFGVYVGQLVAGDFANINNENLKSVLRQHGFDQQTPLWLYILAEAELEQVGERLGRLGGRVVMEVLHAVLEASDLSILGSQDWRPVLPSHRSDRFDLPDLVAFSGMAGTVHQDVH